MKKFVETTFTQKLAILNINKNKMASNTLN